LIVIYVFFYLGNLKSEAKLLIHIDDLNDNPPRFWQMVVLHDQDLEITEPAVSSAQEHYTNISIIDTNLRHAGPVTTMNFTEHRNLPPLVSVLENTPVGTAVLRVLAGDRDAGINSTVTYKLTAESHFPPQKLSAKTYFTVQSQNGEVLVARTLLPETDFFLNITATDGGGLMDNMTVTIHVKDVNDHAPVFKKSWYNFDLEEGIYSGRIVGTIEATDEDYGNNAKISYGVLQNERDDVVAFPFRITEIGGILTVTGEIDREIRDSYTFQVTARDNGPVNNQQRSMVDVEINILDVNDNAPKFYDYDQVMEIPSQHKGNETYHFNFSESSVAIPVYYASVPENSSPGTVVTKLSANDSDFAGNGNGLLFFNIPHPNQNGGNLFSIDSKDGTVMTIGKLNYEAQSLYNITVIASDLGNPSLSSMALLVIKLIDVPEDVEEIGQPMFAHRYYEVEVEENSVVPMPLLSLNVTETYQVPNLKYSIIPSIGSDAFEMSSSNGTLYMVHSPDREQQAKYNLKVRAEVAKRSRGLPVMLYPMAAGRLADLGEHKRKDCQMSLSNMCINGKMFCALLTSL
jgi:hypothetical protein